MMHGLFGTCVSGHKAFAVPRDVGCSRAFGPGCLAHYLPRRCGQASPLAMVKQYAWSTRQRRLLDRYAAVVVASRFMMAEYIRAGLSPDRLAAIPLFTELANHRSILERHDRLIDVLFLGRMTPLKRADVLLRGLASRTPTARVTFARDGPERLHL